MTFSVLMDPGTAHGELHTHPRAWHLQTPRGICFTYATMFALESLGIAGESCANSERVRRACEFLVSKQMADGGWGETYMVCYIFARHRQKLMS
jgi:hypothetical protein